MFEKFTEKARRVIFFARYEASQFGSPEIETEHLLLGLFREDRALVNRYLHSLGTIDAVRSRIEKHTPAREKVSTSIDLPVSAECKRVLAFAAEESERLSHKHIGTEHLLLGILREDKSFAASLLHEAGLKLSSLREDFRQIQSEEKTVVRPKAPLLLSEFSRDLIQAAHANQLDPLIGREKELERVMHILSRRSKNNPVLTGEPGVGKAALVKGLVQRIVEGAVPPPLADKRILALDLSPIAAGTRQTGKFEERLKTIVTEVMEAGNVILFIEELFSLSGTGGPLDAADILRPALARRDIQCLGAATPGDWVKAIEKEPWLEQCFQAVKVPPPDQADAITIMFGIKDRYEKFHGVSYTDEALKYAVYYSERYLPDRQLPDKAIDLIDEAGAVVKLRVPALPEEVVDIKKRIQFVVHRLESAIASHEFEKARFYSEEERKERENLRRMREKYNIDETKVPIVTREDVEETLSRWTEVPATTIRQEGAGGNAPSPNASES